MLKIDSKYMLPGRKYFIKALLAEQIPWNSTYRFKHYQKDFAVFAMSASTQGSAFDWSVRIQDIKECYAIPGSSIEQRDAQFGLLGIVPYELGRLIASYV